MWAAFDVGSVCPHQTVFSLILVECSKATPLTITHSQLHLIEILAQWKALKLVISWVNEFYSATFSWKFGEVF